MADTAHARTMKQVVSELHPLLKEHGFRKQRHTFNRECEPGLVQVVSFQMGPYDPPGTVEIPGLRDNLYGRFTVNLGVFVEQLHGYFSYVPRAKFIAEPDCEIRRRLGELMPVSGDCWWRLDADPIAVATDVRRALEDHGLPFLDSLKSRELIISAWDSVGFAPRGALAVALLHWERGEQDLAEQLIRSYLGSELAPSHREYVEDLLARHGLRAPE
jgi:hypothetical protein